MTSGEATLLSIGEVSRRSGLSISAIRYYESLGLVSSTRGPRRHRRFESAALRRLALITALQNAGFSLEEMAALFGMTGAAGKAERRALVASKLDEVRAQIRRLADVAEALERALDCGCDDLDHCGQVDVTRSALARRQRPSLSRR